MFWFLFGFAAGGTLAILAWAMCAINHCDGEDLYPCQTPHCHRNAYLEGYDTAGDPVFLCQVCADVWLPVEP